MYYDILINLVDTDGDGIDDKFDGYPLDALRTDLIESKQILQETFISF